MKSAALRDSARRPLIGPSQHVEDSAGNGCRRQGVEVASGVAADLGEGSCVRGGDRAAAGHCLDRGLTEALVETRKDERRCASIELEQVVRRHVAANDHTRRHGPPVVPCSREDEREIRPLATDEREGLEQALVVLVGPAVGRVEEERLSFALVGAEARRVDAEVDDANAFRLDAQALDDRLLHVCADCDDQAAGADAASVGKPSVRELGARKEAREKLVLEVEDGRRRRRPAHGRHHDREGEVEPAQVVEVELAAYGAGMSGGQRHCCESSGERTARTVRRHRRLGEPVGGVCGNLGQEDPVLELAHPGKGPNQLTCVRLRPADDSRNEREQADAHHLAADDTLSRCCGHPPKARLPRGATPAAR